MTVTPIAFRQAYSRLRGGLARDDAQALPTTDAPSNGFGLWPAADGAVSPSDSGTSRRAGWIAAAVLVLLGAALGVSQTIHGAYDEATWAPIALGALGLVLALTVGLPRRLPVAALAPLVGLWLWSLLSSSWSDSSEAAHVAANRWLLYAAVLATLCWIIGNQRRRGSILLTGAAAGVLGVAVWMLARMLGGHGPALFLGTRLNDPLGYINGQAGYLLIGVWPCLALAEKRGAKNAVLAGAGMSGIVVLTGLGLLTQSRSWGIGIILTAIVLLAAVPGRRRRAAVILLVGATIALLYAPLADVWRHPSRLGIPTTTTTHHAAVAIVIAALAAGALWALALLAFERLAPSDSRMRMRAARVWTAALAAIAALALVAVAVNGGAIRHRVHNQYEAFVHLAPTGGGTRFFSGGGDRYDYWRVAMLEFRSEPFRGVGAGNYQPGYYLHRRTTEWITQPHSLELQTLAELGIVGFALLGAFLIAVGIGFFRTARAAGRDPVARAVAVAAGGAFVGWLVQTSVDWMHLIPGLTAIALAAAAALLARPETRARIGKGTGTPAPVGARRRPRAAIAALHGSSRLIMIVAVTVMTIAGVLTIAPRVLSLDAQASAQHALADRQPRAAIADATRALDYDPNSVRALVLRAAGFARLHAFEPSLADMKLAVAVEPHNWVTWALLGDLLTRRGERAAAHSAYARAVALNPGEADLRSALASTRKRSRG